MAYVSRRSALTIIAGGTAALAAGRARAEDKAGRVIYPVAVPVYQTQFIADRIGYFKEAGLDCKLVQGGSGVKTREIIASSQGDIGIGDITHPMQLSNHGRAGRVLMPVDTRSSSVMFIIRKDLFDQASIRWKRSRPGSDRTGASRSYRSLRSAAPTMSGPPTTWRRWDSTRR
jgi:NitT/TauT family transport system substrate-binding protein